jgi:hypothetical protein
LYDLGKDPVGLATVVDEGRKLAELANENPLTLDVAWAAVLYERAAFSISLL